MHDCLKYAQYGDVPAVVKYLEYLECKLTNLDKVFSLEKLKIKKLKRKLDFKKSRLKEDLDYICTIDHLNKKQKDKIVKKYKERFIIDKSTLKKEITDLKKTLKKKKLESDDDKLLAVFHELNKGIIKTIKIIFAFDENQSSLIIENTDELITITIKGSQIKSFEHPCAMKQIINGQIIYNFNKSKLVSVLPLTELIAAIYYENIFDGYNEIKEAYIEIDQK